MSILRSWKNFFAKKTSSKPVKIVGSGKYVPQKVWLEDIEREYNIPLGWSAKHSGVVSKHWATHESVAFMASEALKMALTNSYLTLDDVDLIISAGSSYDYPVPHQAPLVKKELNISNKDVPAISVNSTCLSFVTALDLASSLLDNVRYKRIAIVTAEATRKTLNPANFETFTLFGDGAAAVVIEYCPDSISCVVAADMITVESDAEHTIVRGCGIVNHPSLNNWNPELYSFSMNGRALIKLTSERLVPFLGNLFERSFIYEHQISWVIPHQASKMGLELFRKLCPDFGDKTISNLETHGNCIAASIPMALHDAISDGRIKRGEYVLLVGTSAGFSLGGLILRF